MLLLAAPAPTRRPAAPPPARFAPTARCVRAEQSDVDGKTPKEFFDGNEETMAEFESDAAAKKAELGELLAKREEEFFSYQSSGDEVEDDYEDEVDDDDDVPKRPPPKKKPQVDEIDYADDEDEDDEAYKDEM